MPLASSQEQCLSYFAYSLFAAYPACSLWVFMPILVAAYPACSLWLFLPIHYMRLILPAHYGYSCLFIVCGLSCLLIMAIPAYSCMRLILPAYYGYSCLSIVAAYPACSFQGYTMLMASPKGAMPPSSMAQAHIIRLLPKEQCRPAQ